MHTSGRCTHQCRRSTSFLFALCYGHSGNMQPIDAADKQGSSMACRKASASPRAGRQLRKGTTVAVWCCKPFARLSHCGRKPAFPASKQSSPWTALSKPCTPVGKVPAGLPYHQPFSPLPSPLPLLHTLDHPLSKQRQGRSVLACSHKSSPLPPPPPLLRALSTKPSSSSPSPPLLLLLLRPFSLSLSLLSLLRALRRQYGRAPY